MFAIAHSEFPKTAASFCSHTVHRTFAAPASPILLTSLFCDIVGITLGSVSIASELNPYFLALWIRFATHNDELVALYYCVRVAAGEKLIDRRIDGVLGW